MAYIWLNPVVFLPIANTVCWYVYTWLSYVPAVDRQQITSNYQCNVIIRDHIMSVSFPTGRPNKLFFALCRPENLDLLSSYWVCTMP